MWIEYKDFAQNITVIFNRELSLTLKYNYASKLICEILNASMVSFLLYESKEDTLICKGGHINTSDNYFHCSNKNLSSILKNINVYEFFKHRVDITDNNISNFYYLFIEEYPNNKVITQDDFIAIWKDRKSYIKLLDEYLEILKSEKYNIDENTITTEYFRSLLKSKKQASPKIMIQDLSSYDDSKKTCCNILRDNLGLFINNNGFYIGLPLLATERYFGIIRILYPKESDFIINEAGSHFLTDEFQERLGYFSRLISLHIATNYYLESYKKLSLINETIALETINNLNHTCNLLCDLVNCNGSFLRLFSEKTLQPEICGYSSSMKKYVDFLKTFKDLKNPENNKFSITLVDLFKKDNNILAVNFDVESNDTKVIMLYNYSGENEIKETKIELDILDLQSSDYKNKLNELNIHQLAILPIPNIQDSYMIFSNTKNRNFIKSDIEILILAVRGIGLEIKHVLENAKIKDREHLKAQLVSIRNVVHQIGAPLHGVLLHASNLVNKRVPAELVETRTLYLYQMMKNSIRQVKRFQHVWQLNELPICSKKAEKVSLAKYLIERSIEFQSLAISKGITIHVFSDRQDNIENVYIDTELFQEVMNNLIENAVKYSFNSVQLKSKKINYDETDYKSEGNILIYYRNNSIETVVKVTSWGAIIKEEEKSKIFEQFYRGKNADDFSPIGSGIGLFLVKKIVDSMNGKIKLNSVNYKTTFSIIFLK